jgi:TadE-like protein
MRSAIEEFSAPVERPGTGQDVSLSSIAFNWTLLTRAGLRFCRKNGVVKNAQGSSAWRFQLTTSSPTNGQTLVFELGFGICDAQTTASSGGMPLTRSCPQSFRSSRRRGTAAVEFAFVAPIVFVLVFGMIEFGRAIMVQQIITNAAREGARVAILSGTTTTSVTSAVNTYLAAKPSRSPNRPCQN